MKRSTHLAAERCRANAAGAMARARSAAIAAVLVGLLMPALGSAGTTDVVPKGLFVFDIAYMNSTTDKAFGDGREVLPLLEGIKRYEPGGGLQGTVTANPFVRLRLITTQILFGVTDNLTAVLALPYVLDATIDTRMGWTPGDYQSQLGRPYSETDFWQWAGSMGQPRPVQRWVGNQGVLADLVLAARYRLPRPELLRRWNIQWAVHLQGALPTGVEPDPEDLVTAGTSAWHLHSYADLELHLAADKRFSWGGVDRLTVGVDSYFGWLRPRTFVTPAGLKHPLLLNLRPYVGDTYTVDGGDWLASSFVIDVVALVGPTFATWLSKGRLDVARSFPPLVTLTVSYRYLHTAQSDWTSKSDLWDWKNEKAWRPGDKQTFNATATLGLLRLGAPLQLYVSWRTQELVAGRNTRPANVLSVGTRLFAAFW